MSDPGYRVPDGEALIEDMACQLVYYPDIPEYRTILLSQLLELTNWRNWERDDDHKGKDAATSWKAANVLTWECWRMACLEQLQADVSAILAYLQVSNPCCDDNVTYGDGTSFTTDITPNSGDAPDYYGETAVTDWDDWKEHVCFNGNAWVDKLISESVSIENVLAVGGLTIGLLAYAIAGIALFVVGGFISGPVLIVIMSGIVAGYTSELFSDAADDIEDNRVAILCTLFEGASMSDVIEGTVSSLAWSIFYQHIDYDSAVALLYEGGDGTTFLPADTDDTCDFDCDTVQWGEFLYPSYFQTSALGRWVNTGTSWDGEHDGCRWSVTLNGVNYLRMGVAELRDEVGLSSHKGLTIRSVKVDYRHSLAAGGQLRICVMDGTTWRCYFFPNSLTWTTATLTIPTENFVSPYGGYCLLVGNDVAGSAQIYHDNIIIDFDAEI